MDIFDQNTWPLLTDMRRELRDAIFDAEVQQERTSLETQLAAVEREISTGQTLYIPF